LAFKVSKLERDDFYKQLDAECKEDVVEKFKNDLDHLYYWLAIKEEGNVKEQRLLKFTTHVFALFQVYTKYYAKFADLGKLSRPLDTSAALFL
jgi:CRISPR/Cas system CMR-associated protein Cmr5 small subunit